VASLALIVAVAENGVIGIENRLPWHIPEDLQWFKRNTMGKPMIMGRNTFDSLGKPLPGRDHIVLSRSLQYDHERVFVVASLDEAISVANQRAAEVGVDEIMVIGGEQIYRQALPLTEKIYRTLVKISPNGDAFFPELCTSWQPIVEQSGTSNGVNFLFQELEKPL